MTSPLCCFKSGEWITSNHFPGVFRIITKVRKRGYTWTFPWVTDGRDWISENSNDPQMYYWRLATDEEIAREKQASD